MKITQVTASITQTINLGNYESLRVSAGYEATITPEEDATTATKRLFKLCEYNLDKQLDVKLR